jgi:hypothetical protein
MDGKLILLALKPTLKAFVRVAHHGCGSVKDRESLVFFQ